MRYAYRCCLRCRPRLRRCRPHGWKAPACAPVIHTEVHQRRTHAGERGGKARKKDALAVGRMGLRRILRVQQGFYAFQRHTVLSGGIFRSGLFSCQQFVAALRPAARASSCRYPARAKKRRSPICRWPDGRRPPVRPKLLGKACRPAQRKNAFVDRHSCVLLRKSEAGTGPPSDFILTKARARGHQLGVPFRQPAVAMALL
mgnify:CR=1 FL=1